MIKRAIFQDILPWVGEEKILIIKGARQVGKTTLLLYLKKHLEEQGKKVFYFSADQELSNPIFKDVKLFLQYINDQTTVVGDKVFVMIDEFQYIQNAGLFIKNIFDLQKQKIQLIVSGSSSLEISKNSEFLTGRKISFRIHSLSFKEYLSVKSQNQYNFSWKLNDQLSELKNFYQIYQADLENWFLQYLTWGGYPEVVLINNLEKRQAVLKEIVSTYIQKDIAAFLKIENISGFNNLITVLASQVGNLLNKSEISSTLSLNARTVDKYLDILVGTYVSSLVKPWHSNIRKTITKMPKIYLEDFGLMKIFDQNQFSSYDLISGGLVENFVYNELARIFDKEDVFFYRTVSGSEIDFIVKQQQKVLPIEVKFRRNKQNTPKVMDSFLMDIKQDQNTKIVFTQNYLDYKDNTLFIPVVLMPFVVF